MRGKLPTEIFTPSTIVEQMANKARFTVDSCSHFKSVYDPACGDGNILCYVAEVYKKAGYDDDSIIDIIFGADISQANVDKCKERLSTLLPNVNEDKLNAHIRCKDTLAETDNFRYSLVFMNPPYERDLHKKFLLWAAKHAENIVSIQPCQFLYSHKGKREIDHALHVLIDNFCMSIEIVNPNTIWPLNAFASPVGIFYIKPTVSTATSFEVYDTMTDDKYYAYACSAITKNCTKLHNFSDKLSNFMKSNKSLRDFKENKPSKEWIVEIARVRGHINTKSKDLYDNDDFATFVTKDNKPKRASEFTGKQCFSFDTEIEANNFLIYLKTDFARTCLYLSKHGVHLDSTELEMVPYLDYSVMYTDEELFKMLGCRNPHVVQKYY